MEEIEDICLYICKYECSKDDLIVRTHQLIWTTVTACTDGTKSGDGNGISNCETCGWKSTAVECKTCTSPYLLDSTKKNCIGEYNIMI